MFLNVKTSWS